MTLPTEKKPVAGRRYAPRIGNTRAFAIINESLGPPNEPTIEEITQSGTELLRGGHARWRFASRNVKLAGRWVQVQRAWYEHRYGPIPPGRFLLNKCEVRDCIEPDCQFVSHTANMRNVLMSHEGICDSAEAVQCSGQPLNSAGCGGPDFTVKAWKAWPTA